MASILSKTTDEKWWKSATIYQIYPASFYDSNGDGIGDLPGILSKLEYLKDLGVDCVWISPFYKSPNYDMGYDISDYKIPDPTYGTLKDVEDIIAKCHELGLKILFDLICNHTSHLHPWFIESAKSKSTADNPFRKYYIWRPPRYDADGKRLPPTNWRAIFGGSAWHWSEETQEYYLGVFTPQQPDLNWEDEEVREAIYQEAILYWLEKGIDGFRVDTAAKYSKFPFEDAPVTDPTSYEQPAVEMHNHGPRLDEFLREMNRKTFAKYGSVTIGELGGPGITNDTVLDFVHEESQKFSMMIRFDHVKLDKGSLVHLLYPKSLQLTEFKEATEKMQELANPALRGWLCNYLESHDQSRSVSRWCDDSPEYRAVASKMLAIHLLTLSGTTLIYQGEEIGMINLDKSVPPEEYVDVVTVNYLQGVRQAIAKGDTSINLEDALRGMVKLARDHARTPMQWSGDKLGGFTTGDKTWMHVNESYKDINVAQQAQDANSVLSFTKHMLKLRKQHRDTLVFGHFELLDRDNPHTFSYCKTSLDGARKAYVTLNFSSTEQPISIPDTLGEAPQLLVAASAETDASVIKKTTLGPWEGRVYIPAEPSLRN